MVVLKKDCGELREGVEISREGAGYILGGYADRNDETIAIANYPRPDAEVRA